MVDLYLVLASAEIEMDGFSKLQYSFELALEATRTSIKSMVGKLPKAPKLKQLGEDDRNARLVSG